MAEVDVLDAGIVLEPGVPERVGELVRGALGEFAVDEQSEALLEREVPGLGRGDLFGQRVGDADTWKFMERFHDGTVDGGVIRLRAIARMLIAAVRLAPESVIDMSRSMLPGAGPRRDRLKQLRSFCEAVRVGSVSGAARVMHLSQPSVSTQIRSLEEELGVVLLRRRGMGIAPTRAGAILYRVARRIVEGMLRVPELFEEQHHGAGSDCVRIGAGEVSGGSVLPGLVKRFQARYPRIRVEVRTGSGRERLAWLRDFELDLVIAAVAPVPDDIEFHPLVEVDGIVVTPEDHPLAGRDSVAIEELASWPMVAPLAGRHIRHMFDIVLGLHGVHPPIALEVEDWGSILNHVAAGVGIAVVPSLCVAPHEPVAAVRLAHRFLFRTYGLAHRRDRLLPLGASRFVDVAMSEPFGGGGAG